MKTNSSMAKGALWLALLAGIGIVIGLVAASTIQRATHQVPVWVAAQKIPVDQKIKMEDLRKELRPEGGVPADAIKDPAEVVGKYAGATILPGQVIEKGAVADATTMREVVREYGLGYVGMAVQIDSQDMPIDQIHPGDLVAFLGTFQESGKVVTTRVLASRVPVIAVSDSEKKIIVAVPKENAVELARDKAAGKISVVLDPNRYTPGYTEPVASPPDQGPPAAPATTGQSGTVQQSSATGAQQQAAGNPAQAQSKPAGAQ
ncbi:MAG TPA: pilus assembly protein CpaB [Alicyclobacillus sp.]|nr:pilus assembly protein CpaB [Alicyclobacillus sp.]